MFGKSIDWTTRRESLKGYTGLTLNQIQELEREGYRITKVMGEKMFEQVKAFLKEYGGTVFGWVPGPTRRTSKTVVVRGIEYKGGVTMPMLIDFINWFHKATRIEASNSRLYAYFD